MSFSITRDGSVIGYADKIEFGHAKVSDAGDALHPPIALTQALREGKRARELNLEVQHPRRPLKFVIGARSPVNVFLPSSFDAGRRELYMVHGEWHPRYYFPSASFGRAGLVLVPMDFGVDELLWLTVPAEAPGEAIDQSIDYASQMMNERPRRVDALPTALSQTEAWYLFKPRFMRPEDYLSDAGTFTARVAFDPGPAPVVAPPPAKKPWKRIKAGIVKRVRVNKQAIRHGGPERFVVEFKDETHYFEEVEFLGKSKMVWSENTTWQGCTPDTTRAAWLETSRAIRVR